jgi:hypothetical protein
MSNSNCLEGVRCPKCGYEDGFYVEEIVTLLVSDDGTEDRGGDHFWDEESHCICASDNCDQQGPWREFQIENQTGKGGAA